jgi:hypothetical protein
MEFITSILNELHDFTNMYIIVKTDDALKMPGYSIIEKDKTNRITPIILINLGLIPHNDPHVLAHVLAHEYGHHVCKHHNYPCVNLSKDELETRELEADEFAMNFVIKYHYNTHIVIKFLESICTDEPSGRDPSGRESFTSKRISILNTP